MIFIKIILIQSILCLSITAFAQIEHNFSMAPEKTDCHILILKEDSLSNIEEIRNSTFRFKEEMNISRYYAPRTIEYYSCDGITGYLIAVENETITLLYLNVLKTKYDSLSNNDDPITFYKQYFKTR
jgi:hypothetical protein